MDEDQVADDDFPAKEEWIALRLNERKKLEFQNTDLQAFWIAQLSDAPTLAERALSILTSFSTTYLCEKGFSTVMGLKTKKRNRLSVQNDARIASLASRCTGQADAVATVTLKTTLFLQ